MAASIPQHRVGTHVRTLRFRAALSMACSGKSERLQWIETAPASPGKRLQKPRNRPPDSPAIYHTHLASRGDRLLYWKGFLVARTLGISGVFMMKIHPGGGLTREVGEMQ